MGWNEDIRLVNRLLLSWTWRGLVPTIIPIAECKFVFVSESTSAHPCHVAKHRQRSERSFPDDCMHSITAPVNCPLTVLGGRSTVSNLMQQSCLDLICDFVLLRETWLSEMSLARNSCSWIKVECYRERVEVRDWQTWATFQAAWDLNNATWVPRGSNFVNGSVVSQGVNFVLPTTIWLRKNSPFSNGITVLEKNVWAITFLLSWCQSLDFNRNNVTIRRREIRIKYLLLGMYLFSFADPSSHLQAQAQILAWYIVDVR